LKIKFDYIKNPHQQELHDDITTKFLHLSSGFGGGKSYGLIMKALQLSWLNRNIPGGFICPTFADYKKDILPLIEMIMDENKINYKHHKSDHTFMFPWSKGKMYITSAEKKLRGPDWGWACVNEVTLMQHERYKEIIGRVRIKKSTYPQIVSVGTPEGTAHWLYDSFMEEPMRNSRVIYGDTRDNLANLSEDYIQSLEDSYDSTMLDAYLRGMWVNMSSNRFYYSYDPSRNDNKDIVRPNDYSVTHASLDFNVSKMCCTLWHYDGRKLRAFDEIILKDNADTKKMCDALKARGYYPDNTIIYPDPAGNARTTKGRPDNVILKDEGFYQVKVKSTQPRMRTRQLNVNNLLDKGVIEINPIKCKTLKKDLESVEQDPVKLDKVKKDMALTHSSDGMDYLIDIMFPFGGNDKRKSRVVKYK